MSHNKGGIKMCGKFFCGMISGLIVGGVTGYIAYDMFDNSDKRKIKRKAKKLLDKVEKYVGDSMHFSD